MTEDWAALLQFLRETWGMRSLALVDRPRRVTGGYGRRLWHLDLAAPVWAEHRQFQLRCADPGKASLRLEIERLRWLASRGYPVSRPLLWAEDARVVGEPFALLAWVPGATLAERIRAEGWQPDGTEGYLIGHLLARLHALAPDRFPAEAAPGSWAPALGALGNFLGPSRLAALRDWLRGREVQGRAHTICHLDLHPLNVVLSGDEAVVLDWEMARVDDPLLDVAMAQVHTEIALGIGEYPRTPAGFAYSHDVLDAYRALRPVAEADLRYYRALAACRRLGDVAGALRRAQLREEDRAELAAEGAAALGLLDREIGFGGRGASASE